MVPIRRPFAVVLAAGLLAVLLPAAPAVAFPVADSADTYAACGRVFPDPTAYWPAPTPPDDGPSPASPWAKGNAACAARDFLGWDETLGGLGFLASEDMFGDFVEIYDLSADGGRFAQTLQDAGVDGLTAGLPTSDLQREQVPIYLVRVTDEHDSNIPILDREHFVYTLSIHGIERAGVEGGVRAIEDLATWASCEKHGDEFSPADCAQEDAGEPHPILETMPDESITAGEALQRSSVWFVLSNPDGWRRGDKQRAAQDEGSEPGFFYQRYNGNGVDLNRDWPTPGFTFRPYTPWSEPETRAVGEVLKDIRDRWTGGIDLHGQLIDRAFSFTLIGGSQRAYDKDRRVLRFVKGAWQDAEERLQWHPVIKPNDAPESCVEPGLSPSVGDAADCDPSNRIYGVQWGTIWDTIDYTVTGALGDWMDSPLGLGADGIDNEMSMSHLSNCGVGTCFLPDFEQLHVDGNKSLIYAMMHYSLLEHDATFDYDGRAAYLFNPERTSHPGSADDSTDDTGPGRGQKRGHDRDHERGQSDDHRRDGDHRRGPGGGGEDDDDLPPQEPTSFTIDHAGGESTHEFEVQGPDQGVSNGGMSATVTWSNAGAVGAGAFDEIYLEQYRSGEEDPDPDAEQPGEWQVVNSYYDQSAAYAQSGAKLDANTPLPGRYRVRVSGRVPSRFQVDVTFGEEQAWPDPGQLPYDVSNMDFFDDLAQFVPEDEQLVAVPVDDVLGGQVDLTGFDTVVAADNALLPDFVFPSAATAAQEPIDAQVVVPAPGAGTRTAATSGYHEFEIDQAQGALDIEVTSTAVVDPDLYLQIQGGDGAWYDIASGTSGRVGLETLSYRDVLLPGRYRLEIHNWAGSPGPADVSISFSGREAVENPSAYTVDDLEAMTSDLHGFVEGGGNLLLTDDSLRALEWMELVPADHVRKWLVYAGHVQFSTDGGSTSTYDDPLAKDVDQPGAAEGAGHRHQVAEPVPTGYAIQDETGGDMNSHPQWVVERGAFEAAGDDARTVGVVNGDTTLGEIELGNGVVRVLGSLLPSPTEEFDHPFGLSSYGVTYSGYEVLQNLLDWQSPHRNAAAVASSDVGGRHTAAAGQGVRPVDADHPLPTTGSRGALLPLGLTLLLAAVVLRRRMMTVLRAIPR